LKESGEQVHDRIVEVHWDPHQSCWRLMRFRDDKPNGNHKSVVANIIQSIADGVEKNAVSLPLSLVRHCPHADRKNTQLLARSGAIRNAWKARHAPQEAAIKYGPFAPSAWSKVSGPAIVAGMKR
jgi:mRNA guanylyltransferase